MNGKEVAVPFDKSAWRKHALLTCAEMRSAETLSCAKGKLDLYDLMQNAGAAVAQAVQKRWRPCRVLVMCGPGNNGGDGFIAAEFLRKAGWPVIAGAMKVDGQAREVARAKGEWEGETLLLDEELLNGAELVIDALFGTGLKRPLEGGTVQIVEKLNRSGLPVISADLPSGIDGDTGHILGAAVKAKVTVTFFRKKRGHVLFPGSSFCGEIIVSDTGMEDSVLDDVFPSVAGNDPELWINLLPRPRPEQHKYDRGHVLIYGGPEMTGATRMAARAVQRIGAGMVTLAAPRRVKQLYAVALESVLVKQAEDSTEWRELLSDKKKNAILIGPGAGVSEEKKQFVLEALSSRKACVLDADALTVFSGSPEVLFEALHPCCVLTPHEGEFARLFPSIAGKAEVDKISRTSAAAKTAGCVVLLKGSDTVIASPEGPAVVNHNAPPWLATAGAGDVLAGMIAGIMAQGVTPFTAAAAAAFIHGLAAAEFGPGLIAEDLVDKIPGVLKKLFI